MYVKGRINKNKCKPFCSDRISNLLFYSIKVIVIINIITIMLLLVMYLAKVL